MDRLVVRDPIQTRHDVSNLGRRGQRRLANRLLKISKVAPICATTTTLQIWTAVRFFLTDNRPLAGQACRDLHHVQPVHPQKVPPELSKAVLGQPIQIPEGFSGEQCDKRNEGH